MINAMAHFWVWLVGCFCHTSVRTRTRAARIIAFVLWYAVPKRRHVIRTNLRLCFPDWSEEKREQVARSTYRSLARAALDHGVLWKGSSEQIGEMVRFEGLDHILSLDNRPLIVICPHFVGLDAAGIALNRYVRGCSLYQTQSNPVWDAAALAGRSRFSDPVLIAKSNGSDLRPVMRAMKQGMPFYYLPDMDHGLRNSIFVPFFGVPAATLPMASRLARVMKARVCMSIVEMTEQGYTAHISAPLENFPTQDAAADTLVVTKLLERWIERFPDQYLWTHRRFKTRPDGEPSVY